MMDELVHFYETLSPASIDTGLDRVYAPEARFKDPFNEVQGLAAIAAIFHHMYTQVEAPRFRVLDQARHGDDGFLTWEFHFVGRARMCIRGATHVRFGPDGRVILHRDYWDAAEELYEKLPVLGSLMRWLKRRLRTPL
ncbi:nuclear transport factor 2 family protein [Massilia sp. TS11]|uniref:nuclear transport factor 2 family protein n=1 Tax=Massilia sp. TS11 TaxID=2908003 RepID=UPI001EDAF750|nr:nuclear transport factor 2 family protein [Massilia sp. TS11]MCG2585334.1 nuclear transport factor 2 family protein [Massilia sp. TS11]